MTQVVDARGLPCPQPVVRTRTALQSFDTLTTIVDNETSQHNVTRMADKEGYTVRTEKGRDGIYLHISKGMDTETQVTQKPAPTPPIGSLVLVVPDEHMGRGDSELGQILIRAFFHTLGEIEPLPDAVIFMNSGVKLVVEGSLVAEDLQALRERGVEILACGTCLGFYELKERVAVGEVSNMYTIAETMLGAGKVVTL